MTGGEPPETPLSPARRSAALSPDGMIGESTWTATALSAQFTRNSFHGKTGFTRAR